MYTHIYVSLTFGSCWQSFIMQADSYPELHQPAFLPAKLAILARAFLNYVWLSLLPDLHPRMARNWGRATKITMGRNMAISRPKDGDLYITFNHITLNDLRVLNSGHKNHPYAYFVEVQALRPQKPLLPRHHGAPLGSKTTFAPRRWLWDAAGCWHLGLLENIPHTPLFDDRFPEMLP